MCVTTHAFRVKGEHKLNETSFVKNRSKYDVRHLKSGPDGHSSTTSNVFRVLIRTGTDENYFTFELLFASLPMCEIMLFFFNEKLSMCCCFLVCVCVFLHCTLKYI